MVAAGLEGGERTGVGGGGEKGNRFNIIQPDNMPLSGGGQSLRHARELGRLAAMRITQDDGICHNLALSWKDAV